MGSTGAGVHPGDGAGGTGLNDLNHDGPRPPDALPPLRERAHRRARRHTALIRLLRRAIPAGALLTLGALVAWTVIDPFGRLGVAVTLGPISVSGTKIVMENPRLTGFRKETRPYEVTARAAFQDVRRPTIVELKEMRGHVATNEAGGRAHLEAATGVFDTQKEALELKDAIRLWTDEGQEVRLASASVDFKGGTMRSREPVQVSFPNGRIDAQTLEVGDNGRVISFVGGVRTVFSGGEGAPDPKRTPGPKPVLTSSAEPRDSSP